MALTTPPCAGGVGGGVGGVGGGGSSSPQLHRSLERVLDEARTTGALVLAGRKLKEYPAAAAAGAIGSGLGSGATCAAGINDLSDLQSVDLSCNRLSEVPARLCGQCTRLESADFSGNCLRQIPPEIACLKFLRTLAMDRNLLFTLPPHVCRLKQLQILTVRGL